MLSHLEYSAHVLVVASCFTIVRNIEYDSIALVGKNVCGNVVGWGIYIADK